MQSFMGPEASAALQLAVAVPVSDASGLAGAAQIASVAMPVPAAAVAQTTEAQALAQGAVQLKAQAQNFQVRKLKMSVARSPMHAREGMRTPEPSAWFALQAHAEQLAVQSKQAPSEPEAVQVAVQAQSFQAKAQSLEKAAQAQNLQAQAVVHAQAQAQAQAHAHHLVAQAHDHAQAYAQAAAQADHLKKVSSIGQSVQLIHLHRIGLCCQALAITPPLLQVRRRSIRLTT